MNTPQPENSAQKQRMTRFQKGFSGNPLGKPKGTRNLSTRAAQELLDGESEALTRVAIKKALEGDLQALNLCLSRLLPPCRERALPDMNLPTVNTASDMPRMTACILQAVASGDLTPSEGEKLAGLAVSHAKVLEIAELEARIRALEKLDGGGNGNT